MGRESFWGEKREEPQENNEEVGPGSFRAETGAATAGSDTPSPAPVRMTLSSLPPASWTPCPSPQAPLCAWPATEKSQLGRILLKNSPRRKTPQQKNGQKTLTNKPHTKIQPAINIRKNVRPHDESRTRSSQSFGNSQGLGACHSLRGNAS